MNLETTVPDESKNSKNGHVSKQHLGWPRSVVVKCCAKKARSHMAKQGSSSGSDSLKNTLGTYAYVSQIFRGQ